jgi:hypothetical protein
VYSYRVLLASLITVGGVSPAVQDSISVVVESPPTGSWEIVGNVALVISAVAAAIAAGISAWSVRRSMEYRSRELKWHELEKRHVYYRSVVMDPGLQEISDYRKDTKKVLKDGKNRIMKMHAENKSSEEIHDEMENLMDSFISIHLNTKEGITDIIHSWVEDMGARNKVVNIFEDIEEEIAKKVKNLSHRNSDANFDVVINSKVSNVIKIIMKNDPTHEAEM